MTGRDVAAAEARARAAVRAAEVAEDAEQRARRAADDTAPWHGVKAITVTQPTVAPPASWSSYMTYGGGTSGSVGDADTVVIPSVPQDAPRFDPVPPDLGPSRGRRVQRDGVPLTHRLIRAAALGVLISAAFLGGQWTTQNGVEPVLPMPMAHVQTAAQTARLWILGTPAEQAQQCEWLATPGDTRGYVVDQWVAHLRAPEGGQLDEVDPAVVAGVLDDACAGRAPGRKG